MADPISSLNQSNPSNVCIDDGEAEAAPAAALSTPSTPSDATSPATPATVSPAPSAVRALVDKFVAASVSVRNDLAVDSSVQGPRTSSGMVPDGGSHRVSASLLTHQVSVGPVHSNLELGSVSVQYGKDNDVQATLARRTTSLAHAGYGLSVTGDAGAVRANLGEHNDDGSLGGNIGAGVELVGVEATLSTPYGSLTGGASISASLSGSMGVRDADHDGKPEFCAKFSIPAYTVGACVEQFW